MSVLSISFYGQTAKEYDANGDAKFMSGDYKGAIQEYSNFIKLRPKVAAVYEKRGEAKRELKEYKDAIEDYSKAIELNQDPYGFAYYLRGNAKQKLGDEAGACADWNKALGLGDKNSEKMISKYCK